MKSYLSLIPVSAKVHRRQNRMTLLCIIIAVFLVTAIFSMAQMWTDSGIEDMRQKHGDWHIVLQNIPEKSGDQIRQRSDILYSSWYEDLNTTGDEGYSINGKNAALYGVEESYMAHIWKYPVEGNYPRNERKLPLAQMQKNFWGSGSETRSCCRLPAEIWNIRFPVFMRMTVNLTISLMAAVCIWILPDLGP